MTDARPAERFRALHYLAGAGACGWFAVEPVSRRLVMYREWVPDAPISIARFARGIRERSTGTNGYAERYSGTWGNEELFAGKDDAGRPCDALTWEGVDCYPAPGDVDARADRLLAYTEPVWLLLPGGHQEETSRLVVDPSCVRTAAALQKAGRDSEDPLVLLVRYACVSRDPGECRLRDPEQQALDLAERETLERERRRDEGRPRRPAWR